MKMKLTEYLKTKEFFVGQLKRGHSIKNKEEKTKC